MSIVKNFPYKKGDKVWVYLDNKLIRKEVLTTSHTMGIVRLKGVSYHKQWSGTPIGLVSFDKAGAMAKKLSLEVSFLVFKLDRIQREHKFLIQQVKRISKLRTKLLKIQ